jgi:pyrophosphatase PpaX
MHFNLETVLFDLDGVLANTAPQMKRTYLDVLQDFQIESPSELILANIVQLSPQKGLRQLFGEKIGPANDSFNRHWKINIRHVKSYEGITELVNNLSSKGKILGVVTSRNRLDTMEILANNSLGTLMKVIVTWGDYRVAKPSPKCIQVALRMIQKPPDTVSYVGDQPSDIYAANAAGVVGFAATWGGHINRDELLKAGASAILRNPYELIDLI